MRSLPATSHEHHELIEPHVDRLPELAEMIGTVTPEAFSTSFQDECSFIIGRLVPHMEAIEMTLYGRLEQVMDRRHSMEPMRQEHERLRDLFRSLCEYGELVADERLTEADQVGLRRVLYRLFAMLKVHLAEEQLYLGVLDRNLTAEEKDALAQGIDHAAAEPL
jgi:Hemerythrin HHE cation binding domain